MPIANFETYCRMLDNAKAKKFAYPAVNVTSMATANAAIAAFAAKRSDGIIQVSTGGGSFAAGLALKDSVLGSISIAQHLHLVASHYDINIALHTDHCQPDKVDSYLRPLIAETARRRKAGMPNLFQSHMYDGSSLPLEENIALAKELLKECAEQEIILEVEAGVVGGEEDGVSHEGPAEKLYTTPGDMVYVHEQLHSIGRFLFAATFGNVHGSYKPGVVKLRPEILRDGQEAVTAKHGASAHFDLVFHGGSGSELSKIHETLQYGVVKMNIDTDTQYAFTRPIVDHIMTNYDAVLKVDGEIGAKKKYDPRSYLKAGEKAMRARIERAIDDLQSGGTTLTDQ